MLLGLGLVEYCAIVAEMDEASGGSVRLSVGIGEWPEVEVSMRVFMCVCPSIAEYVAGCVWFGGDVAAGVVWCDVWCVYGALGGGVC